MCRCLQGNDMKTDIQYLMAEALRRSRMPAEKHKPLLQRWVGLGTEAAYRPALRAGLLRWVGSETPRPRIMGWLQLTEKGAAFLLDNAELLLSTKTGPGGTLQYYQVAGGLTAR
jgi:hypothetical protein